jgi:hypothetical protein
MKGEAMKTLRTIGSLAFVLGLFVTIFAGVPWHVIVEDDPVVPLVAAGGDILPSGRHTGCSDYIGPRTED